MKKNSLIFGGIAVLITAAVAYLVNENIFKLPMCLLALMFIIISEVVTALTFSMTNGETKKFGAAFASLIHTAVTMAISLLFCNILVFAYGWFIAVNLITLAILAGIIFALFSFSKTSKDEDIRFKTAKKMMLESRLIVEGLKNDARFAAHSDALNALSDALKYSDDSVIDEADAGIYHAIELLRDTAESDGIQEQINGILHSIEQRNFAVKAKKAL